MKKGCLSEEIFEVVSNEESHYKRRSFDEKARRIFQDEKTLYFAELLKRKIKKIAQKSFKKYLYKPRKMVTYHNL